MLTTILVLLIVLWLLGMVSSYTLGGFIHILLCWPSRSFSFASSRASDRFEGA